MVDRQVSGLGIMGGGGITQCAHGAHCDGGIPALWLSATNVSHSATGLFKGAVSSHNFVAFDVGPRIVHCGSTVQQLSRCKAGHRVGWIVGWVHSIAKWPAMFCHLARVVVRVFSRVRQCQFTSGWSLDKTADEPGPIPVLAGCSGLLCLRTTTLRDNMHQHSVSRAVQYTCKGAVVIRIHIKQLNSSPPPPPRVNKSKRLPC